MTLPDLQYLLTPAAGALIAQNAAADASQWVLANRAKLGPQAALIATQIALRQKAHAKLPTWAHAETVLEPQAFEQSTAEATLSLKEDWRGQTALDLTCGLGLDAWALARRFERVVALERNEVLVHMARHNFKQLGVANIEVVHADAAQWLQAYGGPPFDLIYADPARRTARTVKAIALADMEPNVLNLLPQLQQHGAAGLLKLSPLYEVTQAWKDLPHVRRVLVLGVASECKEVLVELDFNHTATTRYVEARMLRRGLVFSIGGVPQQPLPPFASAGRYLYEPDVTLYKAALLPAWLQQHPHAQPTGPQGYCLSNDALPDVAGRGFAVQAAMPYKPRIIADYLKAQQLRQANVARRGFRLTVAEIRKQLKLAEGGTDYLFCTDTPAGPMAYFCRPINESSSG
jgi:protein-L-isoaspartate O-methyltransferase